MKVSVGIACYFSSRRDRVPDPYIEDYLYFIKVQIDSIKKIEDQIHKVYIACTYDEASVDINYINEYLNDLINSNKNIVILNRPNLGGSYAGYHDILKADNDESDYIVLTEDDYALTQTAISNMLEYYDETPDMIYLCQLWNTNRYTKDGLDIPEHAQMSGGMINAKLYNKLKKERNLDFTLFLDPGKIAIYNNQVCFLEQYRKNGILIRDMKEKNACVYLNDKNSVINFGNPNGEDVLIPISDWYPNHCPNLRYTW